MRRRRLLQRRRLDAHVEGGAHVEAHGQPVQLGHHHVLEARPLQLLRGPEHFRSDEPGDVVDDRPRAGLPLNVPGHAVGAGLERHHVHAFRRAVGDRRSLPGLEVAAVEPARQVEDAVDVEADHARQRLRRPRQALEADVDWRALARPRLLDDVRQHAVPRRQLQPLDDAPKQIFQADDRLHVVARRVQPDDDVAAAVGEPFEDRQQNVVFIVAGAVRLDARAEVLR